MIADQTPVCASRCSCCSECAGPIAVVVQAQRHVARGRGPQREPRPIRRERHAELRGGGVRVQLVERPGRLHARRAHHAAVCIFLDEQQLLLMKSAQGVGILPEPAA